MRELTSGPAAARSTSLALLDCALAAARTPAAAAVTAADLCTA
jgi:hypothetical protein